MYYLESTLNSWEFLSQMVFSRVSWLSSLSRREKAMAPHSSTLA